MEKETYTPQIYIKIDKIVFKNSYIYPTLEKNDNRRFSVDDHLWSGFYEKYEEKEKKEE